MDDWDYLGYQYGDGCRSKSRKIVEGGFTNEL
jgi:hypothetical protein